MVRKGTIRSIISSCMTDSFSYCQQNLSSEKFPEKKLSVGYFYWETPCDRYGMFLRSFLRRKASFGYCFSETNILWLCTSFVLHKVKKTFGRFQVKGHRAYQCKKILGLCQHAEKSTQCMQLGLIHVFRLSFPQRYQMI